MPGRPLPAIHLLQVDRRPHAKVLAMRRVAAPVLIGGTGRSGTTILAELIGQHSSFSLIPIEASFHCDARGFQGLREGTYGIEEFRARFLKHYFFRKVSDGTSRGLKLAGISRARAVSAIDEFVAAYPANPTKASATLMHRLFDPLAEESGAKSWIEMTPRNVLHASYLQSLFPLGRMIHIVRDGRDVATSVAGRRWGPNDPFEALEWWGGLLRQAQAAEGKPRNSLLVGFESLIFDDRERQYDRILRFLGVADEPAMREFFEEKMAGELAHRGRWRNSVPAEDQDRFDEAYERIVGELRADGIAAANVLGDGGQPRRRLRWPSRSGGAS